MTPEQKHNLERLFNPRHMAVIGGRDAAVPIGECDRIGFAGEIWPVNPKRETLGGRRCFASIADLPEAPDAAFVAVPASAAPDVIRQLAERGAGGAVCYTAGFGEAGNEAAEAALVEAAGAMALVGPNCYGLINYVGKVALWPFAHGGACPGYGAAIITQSGMLSSDLTMSQRSVPFAYMVSAGNQAALGLEAYVDFLAEKPEVRAIGLHIEGLKDIRRFSDAALKALELNKPIVVLKTGTSKIGAQLTINHTGSLSGTDDLYRALFDRLGIIQVSNPADLLETLKFLCICGIPKGRKVMGFTCSGGGATMLADYGEPLGLDFPAPRPDTAQALASRLPAIATVSNPLDYTTPIWGLPDRVKSVMDAALDGSHDVAVLVQDYPLPGLDESKQAYLNDAAAFLQATGARNVPAAICSTLPENVDADTRAFLVANNVAPMQGIHETLDAVANAAWFGARRSEILGNLPKCLLPAPPGPAIQRRQIDEWTGKQELRAAGLDVPPARLVTPADAVRAADALGFPLALKMNSADLAHKTEAGAVRLGLQNADEVAEAIARMHDDVQRARPDAVSDRFILERMIEPPLAELLVSIRRDPQFGLAMTLASGGVFVELIGDAETLLLPASEADILAALTRLKIAPLLDGFRGRPAADRHQLARSLSALARYAETQSDRIDDVEINPLFILPDRVCAVDVLMHCRG